MSNSGVSCIQKFLKNIKEIEQQKLKKYPSFIRLIATYILTHIVGQVYLDNFSFFQTGEGGKGEQLVASEREDQLSGVEGRERGHIDNTWGTKGVHALFLYCTKSNCICLNICQIIRHECILKLSNPNKGNSTYSCFLLSLSRYLLLPHGH